MLSWKKVTACTTFCRTEQKSETQDNLYSRNRHNVKDDGGCWLTVSNRLSQGCGHFWHSLKRQKVTKSQVQTHGSQHQQRQSCPERLDKAGLWVGTKSILRYFWGSIDWVDWAMRTLHWCTEARAKSEAKKELDNLKATSKNNPLAQQCTHRTW